MAHSPVAVHSVPKEPRYLWCSDCETVVSGVHDEREWQRPPSISDGLVKVHRMTIARRSVVRVLAGDMTAADALERLAAHSTDLALSVASDRPYVEAFSKSAP